MSQVPLLSVGLEWYY